MEKEYNVKEAQQWGREELSGSESSALDTDLLLADCLDLTRIELMLSSNQQLEPQQLRRFQERILLRKAGKPVAYLLGTKPFMDFDLIAEEGVLIPRPDTELLVETVRERIIEAGQKRGAEIGVGSGAISCSLLTYCPDLTMVATDINEKAIALTKKNAELLGVSDRIRPEQRSILDGLQMGFDFVVSNPPYISKDEMRSLPPDVKNYEPSEALDGGADGLYFYRTISEAVYPFLVEGGFLAFEIGYSQASAVQSILQKAGYRESEVYKDLAGLDRVVLANK